MRHTFKILIKGQVQGVGFRPFVHQLAQKRSLAGTVCNNGNGVLIFINATQEEADRFLSLVLSDAPEVSQILGHNMVMVAPRSFSGFKIEMGPLPKAINVPLTPDFGICPSCEQEIKDPKNRRFGYPFTTCTACGPRYAITQKFPFERAHTSMVEFNMCASCRSEYGNANDKRFHSQTNSCASCGIALELTDNQGNILQLSQEQHIRKTADLLGKGRIIAIKNTNGYLLCCDATNEKAIHRLRQRKQRPTKPFALLYPSVTLIQNHFRTTDQELQTLTSPARPIVLLEPKPCELTSLAKEAIAPGLGTMGAMLPSSALLSLLLRAFDKPLIATSGNIHGAPIIARNAQALALLAPVADYFLKHNLHVAFPQDDSVIRFAGNQKIILRRARGLAPNYLKPVPNAHGAILAMGGQLKSTVSFLPNGHVYISPYFGDLDRYEVLVRYKKSVQQYIALFGKRPSLILTDLHPQYQSTVWGKELAQDYGTPCTHVQHHKAHFASVLGENDLFATKEKVLGVIWDGTGYGEDGTIWGGEFFEYQDQQMTRVGHFEPMAWLAGDKMAKEPRLCLLSLLPEEYRSGLHHRFTPTEFKVYTKMLEKRVLETTSAGRLFDAVAALLLNINTVSYEGEAAMRLEELAMRHKGHAPVSLLPTEWHTHVPTKLLLTNILAAMEKGKDKAFLAHSFIYSLAMAIVQFAKRKKYALVACSGGVFQNALLVQELTALAEGEGLKLKFNRILSCNDENISFGQLCYYQHIKT